MSCKAIVVNLAVDANPAPIVKLATELARRFEAHLVGFAAADVPPLDRGRTLKSHPPTAALVTFTPRS